MSWRIDWITICTRRRRGAQGEVQGTTPVASSWALTTGADGHSLSSAPMKSFEQAGKAQTRGLVGQAAMSMQVDYLRWTSVQLNLRPGYIITSTLDMSEHSHQG